METLNVRKWVLYAAGGFKDALLVYRPPWLRFAVHDGSVKVSKNDYRWGRTRTCHMAEASESIRGWVGALRAKRASPSAFNRKSPFSFERDMVTLCDPLPDLGHASRLSRLHHHST